MAHCSGVSNSSDNVVPLRGSETGLPRYDAMCTAIAECNRVVGDLVLIEEDDKVEALKFWARVAQNLQPERQAAEVRLALSGGLKNCSAR